MKSSDDAHDSDPEADLGSQSVWLVGASEKSQMLGAALCGLGRWGPQRTEELQVLGELGDLEDLLFGQAEAGTLILDYDLVPIEDIGFVRRFLDRNAGWRMLVVGAERQADSALRLLQLARSEWLTWPPNLHEVNALLGQESNAISQPSLHGTIAPSPAEAFPSPKPTPRLAPHALGVASVPNTQWLDLGKLFKELLINEHLAGHKWMLDFQDDLTLPIDQRLAKLSFGAFINLARACAGREGLVKAQLQRSGLEGDPADTICLQLTFPEGILEPADQNIVLLRPIRAEGKLGSAAKAALIAAEALRKRGGRVNVRALGDGALCLEMHISTADLEVLELERLEAASGAKGGSGMGEPRGQDPFAR